MVSNLVKRLRNEKRSFTVLAPTNEAFAKLPEHVLDKIFTDADTAESEWNCLCPLCEQVDQLAWLHRYFYIFEFGEFSFVDGRGILGMGRSAGRVRMVQSEDPGSIPAAAPLLTGQQHVTDWLRIHGPSALSLCTKTYNLSDASHVNN